MLSPIQDARFEVRQITRKIFKIISIKFEVFKFEKFFQHPHNILMKLLIALILLGVLECQVARAPIASNQATNQVNNRARTPIQRNPSIRLPIINAPPPAQGAGAFQQVCLTRTPACTRERIEVCGRKRDGSSQTYSNKCVACSNADVVSYSQGACRSSTPPPSNPPATTFPTADLSKPAAVCVGPPSPVCTLQYFPICGKLANGTFSDFGNKCSACAQSVVGYWTGLCPAPPVVTPPPGGFPPGVTPCTSRNPVCGYIYLPVCGKKNDGTSQTYSNDCEACKFPEVYGYVSNACPPTRPPVLPPAPVLKNCNGVPRACTFDINPVCGKTIVGQWIQYDNKCTACQNRILAGYTEGKCPATSTPVTPILPIQRPLENCQSRNPICGYINDPVCAELTSKQKLNYANSCLACQNPLTVGYRKGSC